MKDHIDKCAVAASRHIGFLLEEEKEPFTMNDHYFMDYRAKFLTYYKDARRTAKSQFMRNLKNREDGDVMETITEALGSLARAGLEAKAPLLANLLTDPKDPAIEIMADVRAYFQGSSSILLLPVRLYRV